MGHFAETLELIPGPLAAGGEFGIFSQTEGIGLADEMGKAGLTLVGPFAIDGVVVAHEDAVPVADEFLEGLLGTVGMDHEEGDQRPHHHPEPVKFAPVFPGGFIEVVDGGAAGLVCDGLVMWESGCGHTVDQFLQSAEAYADAKHGGTEGSDGIAAVSRNAGNFGDQCGKPWAEAVAVFLGGKAFADFTTIGAAALEEDKMENRQN